jgi:hypothetical protein
MIAWRCFHREKKCARSERVEHDTPRTPPTFSLDFARAPSVEQRWERRHVAQSVHNAGASAATVRSVEN